LPSFCVPSTTAISPSSIIALIEESRTRGQLVAAEFGHHSGEAAITSSTAKFCVPNHSPKLFGSPFSKLPVSRW
jgi:hypothetical protein